MLPRLRRAIIANVQPRAVYLDHNATTPVHPAVRDAMLPWLGDVWGNPSSAHAYGRSAADALSHARERVAALVGARAEEIVFTSGGTEADNLAVLGTRIGQSRIVTSAVEHPAIDAAVRVRTARGCEHTVLAVDAEGRVDLRAAADALARPAGLVSVILAQNETGVVQPIAEIAARARAAASDVVVHADGAQAVGKIPVDVAGLGVDLLTIVGHKFYAPAGIGALVIRRGVTVDPRAHGGGQEHGLRSGTEPVALAVALAAACDLAARDLAEESARQRKLRELLFERLQAGIPELVRSGAGVETLPNTLHVRIPGVVGAKVLAAAPEVAAATGSACHSEHDAPSGVLAAMGVPAREAMGALRLSLGRATTEADIERAAAALIAGWHRARA
jgi:cysteine desulfurase